MSFLKKFLFLVLVILSWLFFICYFPVILFVPIRLYVLTYLTKKEPCVLCDFSLSAAISKSYDTLCNSHTEFVKEYSPFLELIKIYKIIIYNVDNWKNRLQPGNIRKVVFNPSQPRIWHTFLILLLFSFVGCSFFAPSIGFEEYAKRSFVALRYLSHCKLLHCFVYCYRKVVWRTLSLFSLQWLVLLDVVKRAE